MPSDDPSFRTSASSGDTSPISHLLAPDTLIAGRYRLRKRLGRGGFSVVWLAHDEDLDVPKAIKFMTQPLDLEAVEEMRQEVRRGLRLTHPHIVRVHDLIQDDELAGITMEYVDGATFAEMKARHKNRRFEVFELERYVRELCDALHYAHTEGKMVHRDLKPANLMMDRRGRLRITDFGIARSIADTHTRLTNTQGTSGTLPYMSPQQLGGYRAQVTDDVYAVGATLYDLLTGKPPFYTGHLVEQIQNKAVEDMAARRQELGVPGDAIPRVWEQTIRAALAKKPEHRPQSAAEFAARLGLPHAPLEEAETRTSASTIVPSGVGAPDPTRRPRTGEEPPDGPLDGDTAPGETDTVVVATQGSVMPADTPRTEREPIATSRTAPVAEAPVAETPHAWAEPSRSGAWTRVALVGAVILVLAVGGFFAWNAMQSSGPVGTAVLDVRVDPDVAGDAELSRVLAHASIRLAGGEEDQVIPLERAARGARSVGELAPDAGDVTASVVLAGPLEAAGLSVPLRRASAGGDTLRYAIDRDPAARLAGTTLEAPFRVRDDEGEPVTTLEGTGVRAHGRAGGYVAALSVAELLRKSGDGRRPVVVAARSDGRDVEVELVASDFVLDPQDGDGPTIGIEGKDLAPDERDTPAVPVVRGVEPARVGRDWDGTLHVSGRHLSGVRRVRLSSGDRRVTAAIVGTDAAGIDVRVDEQLAAGTYELVVEGDAGALPVVETLVVEPVFDWRQPAENALVVAGESLELAWRGNVEESVRITIHPTGDPGARQALGAVRGVGGSQSVTLPSTLTARPYVLSAMLGDEEIAVRRVRISPPEPISLLLHFRNASGSGIAPDRVYLDGEEHVKPPDDNLPFDVMRVSVMPGRHSWKFVDRFGVTTTGEIVVEASTTEVTLAP